MSISGISDSTTAGLLSGTTGVRGGRLEDKLQALQDAIASKDLDAVQKAFDAISKNASGNGNDPIGQFLSSVEDALSRGDLDALEEASETFSSFKPSENVEGSAPPPPSQLSLDIETGNAFTSLLEALNSSDEDASQTAFNTLIEALSQNDSDDDSDNPLKAALVSVGDALSSGDLTAAQNYLNDILLNLPNGALFNASV